ncbi:hypothetical protein M8C13_05190 [Crossiella sp. SN42]|uniref:hypothetical protein n=1 Tax=Crossiella sp. SN42 TaxID=2944808 RepID=UPI00207CFE70|nr:hypothetical protein [Crossiella sp. SN42]MCO1575153.1 hypothetical protein [Crossiella sp. SN42]
MVTTRHRGSALDGTGRHRIEVDLFTPAESLALITERLARRLRQADGTAELAEALGPDHRDTLTTRNNLAYWRGDAGDINGCKTG